MKWIIIFRPCATSVLLASASLMAAPAFAGGTAGTTKTNLVETAAIINTADLNFGKIIMNGSGAGIVTINARTGARTANANVTLASTTGFGRATFLVTGEPTARVSFSVSSPTVFLAGPGAPLRLDNLRINRNNAGQQTLPRNYNIPNNGRMNIGMGGRLRMASNQAPGLYSGTFDLTMAYQ